MRTLRSASVLKKITSAAVAGSLTTLTWCQAGRYIDADTLWKATLALNPACWTAHEHLAASLQQSGQPVEAAAHYQAALQINPDSVDALTNLGQIEMDDQPARLAEAKAHLEHAIDVNDQAAAAHSNLGLVELRLGQPANAVREQKEALRIRPDLAEVHCQLTVALEALREKDDAAAEGRVCAQQAPDLAERIVSVHQNQGEALMRAGNRAGAVEEFQQALRIQPDTWTTRRALAGAESAAGQFDAALSDYRLALSAAPALASADIRNDLGLTMSRQGKFADAIGEFAEALRLRPDFAEARTNLARAEQSLSTK
jgi:tetratricopeptide (TPR) repeat protein